MVGPCDWTGLARACERGAAATEDSRVGLGLSLSRTLQSPAAETRGGAAGTALASRYGGLLRERGRSLGPQAGRPGSSRWEGLARTRRHRAAVGRGWSQAGPCVREARPRRGPEGVPQATVAGGGSRAGSGGRGCLGQQVLSRLFLLAPGVGLPEGEEGCFRRLGVFGRPTPRETWTGEKGGEWHPWE